jgi:hypothetical protein
LASTVTHKFRYISGGPFRRGLRSSLVTDRRGYAPRSRLVRAKNASPPMYRNSWVTVLGLGGGFGQTILAGGPSGVRSCPCAASSRSSDCSASLVAGDTDLLGHAPHSRLASGQNSCAIKTLMPQWRREIGQRQFLSFFACLVCIQYNVHITCRTPIPLMQQALRNGKALEALLHELGPDLLRHYRRQRDSSAPD